MKIFDENGSSRPMPLCSYPHYTSLGQRIGADGSHPQTNQSYPPTVNGWVADAYNPVSGVINWMSVKWTVPSSPTNQGSQIVYFFPGIKHNTTMPDNIIQPVLGWNQLSFTNQWSVAAWSCCKGGNNLHSSAVGVSTGDIISGYMHPDSSTEWYIGINKWVTDHCVLLTYYDATVDETYDLAFGGALEAYSISNCNQYPASGTIAFGSIYMLVNGSPYVPFWTTEFFPVSPSCSIGMTTSSSSVTINY